MDKKSTALKLLDDGLENFIGFSQRQEIKAMIQLEEEGDYYADLVIEMANRIKEMPVTYQTQDIKIVNKVLCLHYFGGSVDAWIVERDVGDALPDPDAPMPDGVGMGEQLQAYGKITLVGGGWDEAEWGYINIKEMIRNGIELDLHFEPIDVLSLITL